MQIVNVTSSKFRLKDTTRNSGKKHGTKRPGRFVYLDSSEHDIEDIVLVRPALLYIGLWACDNTLSSAAAAASARVEIIRPEFLSPASNGSSHPGTPHLLSDPSTRNTASSTSNTSLFHTHRYSLIFDHIPYLSFRLGTLSVTVAERPSLRKGKPRRSCRRERGKMVEGLDRGGRSGKGSLELGLEEGGISMDTEVEEESDCCYAEVSGKDVGRERMRGKGDCCYAEQSWGEE
ncbi:hypothetical protein V8E36_009974 [Tilletia maclaganii]